MIDIAPKALRFARLAAQEQPQFASDPEIAIILQREEHFRQQPAHERVGRYIAISERTADFCFLVMTALLEQKDRFSSSEWDGNDFAFLEAAAESLREQLTRSDAPSP